MDCRKYRNIINLQLEAGVSDVERLELERHLNGCSSCRDFQAELSQVDAALTTLPLIKAPDSFTKELLAKLPAHGRKAVPYQYLSPRIRAIGATAALVVLLGSPLYALVESPRPIVESSDLQAQFSMVENTVIVPAGSVIEGDIKVYNGHLKVLGSIQGDVHLVSSSYTLENGGTVNGRISVITWSWLERLQFGLVQISQDVKSYVNGALK